MAQPAATSARPVDAEADLTPSAQERDQPGDAVARAARPSGHSSPSTCATANHTASLGEGVFAGK